MKRILILLCLTFCLVTSLPAPFPQGDEDEAPQPPLPGSKPPDFLASITNDDDSTPKEQKEPPPVAASGTAPPVVGTPKTAAAGTGQTISAVEDECGPACMMANQTPIILLVLILILIILFLIILFGCYFMKKLHGKAIFTTGQRHRNMVGASRGDVDYVKSGNSGEVLQQTRTFETVLPGTGKSETKQVVTTTTTKIIQSGSSREGTLESPSRIVI